MAEERVQRRSATILAAHIVANSRLYESGERRTRIDFTNDIARRFGQGSYKTFIELPSAPATLTEIRRCAPQRASRSTSEKLEGCYVSPLWNSNSAALCLRRN